VEATEVVVIGAGPSGLAVGACLKQRRVDFIIVEKEHQVGSSWRRHYERLHLHTIRAGLHCPFEASTAPRYVPRALVVRYLEEYAASFDLKPHFGENVHAMRKQGNEWLIESAAIRFLAPL
jgi:indole-3-pyruvate monooxygenase